MEHEYSIVGGLNRAKIGHTIGGLAAAISSVVVTAFLALVKLAHSLGILKDVPSVVLWPVTAGVVYGALYWLFDRKVWKLPYLARLLRVPDLSGKWQCVGQSIQADGTPGTRWSADVVIVQSWDRVRIRLKTFQSVSNSVTAAIVYDEADGFRLMYNYKNEPNIGEGQLSAHRGFAELLFTHDLSSAAGEYFNGHGRFTYGTMTLTRGS
ncbi:hypothetical protein C7401_10576 [Paraburkholderia unamae]|uniref:Cap15 family cyclic dinucleotide receptor domain-containing protein n=1 Tax=Paraburkholderia unamae TaxID=219649 RepID=UPI000DC3E31A|nr:hypothetical protein [Paraburkholderia unamae]RAR63819.1 hypothetical protein C7401_10576 [Paraburkholderia unamae]